jgi:hypothetical protein
MIALAIMPLFDSCIKALSHNGGNGGKVKKAISRMAWNM